jgi:uncharacterized membrane protein YccC
VSITTTHLREAFKLALSMALFYWLALAMNWSLPKYGGMAILFVNVTTRGASMQKGAMRIVGTTVGLAVGLFVLAVFSQDRVLMPLFLAAYLVVTSYFLLGSRYSYAWFLVAFLPPLIWGTTYGDVDGGFHYAVFRYLETSAGILIYTIISAILWPINAGDALQQQGAALWTGCHESFGKSRRQLEGGVAEAESQGGQARLQAAFSSLSTTLRLATTDTPEVMSQKRAWKFLALNARAVCDALDMWQTGLEDCRRLDMGRLLPKLEPSLDTIGQRLARIEDLWSCRSAGNPDPEDAGDEALLSEQTWKVDRKDVLALSPFDRAAFLGLLDQLRALDSATRDLLHTMRVLADRAPASTLAQLPLPADPHQTSKWDPDRLIHALQPSAAFLLAYVFWIYVNPPTGPTVVFMAAVMGLVFMKVPISPFVLLRLFLLAAWLVVAPIYFFLMPQLGTGAGLLALIFIFTFVASLIGSKSPGLKLSLILMFMIMTGISNDQSYSFFAVMNTSIMLTLVFLIVAIVRWFWGPLRPEQILVADLRRFFRHCARMSELDHRGFIRPSALRAKIAPAPGQLRAVETKINYDALPGIQREQVQSLLDAVQSLSTRLEAFHVASSRVALHDEHRGDALASIGARLRDRVHQSFQRSSRLQAPRADEWVDLGALRHRLEEQFEALVSGTDENSQTPLDDRTLVNAHAMLDSVRGLVLATVQTERAMGPIKWDRWTEARF